MIEFENPQEEFESKELLEPLDWLGWHRILPGEQIEIVECRQYKGRVWLVLSCESCLDNFAHNMRLIGIVDVRAETYFVLALRPATEIPGPDSWPRNLVVRLTSDKQLLALSDRAFDEVEDAISKSLESPSDVLQRAREIFDSSLLDWDSENVFAPCPYKPEESDYVDGQEDYLGNE